MAVFDKLLAVNVDVDIQVYRLIIGTCKNAEPVQWRQANAVFQYMQKNAHFQPSVNDYNLLISVSGKAGMWRQSLQTFNLMAKQGIAPNTSTFDALAQACKSVSIEDAPAIYETMKFAGVPEFLCYSAAVNAVESRGLPAGVP
jgi:pentatricopeptide repeat protein